MLRKVYLWQIRNTNEVILYVFLVVTMKVTNGYKNQCILVKKNTEYNGQNMSDLQHRKMEFFVEASHFF
ncbi:MAG: hypothetical protein MR922_01940 [Lachnospiraceae bacterium]|nr:hypothetical protein [Lachnospiraceae bacterium]